MKTEKTKGDMLAEQIDKYIKANLPHFPMMFGELSEALAEYRKPDWTLGRSVNGFTLADGQEWHRNDWTKDMLPDGWRPLLKEETYQPGDECDHESHTHKKSWTIVLPTDCIGAICNEFFWRTRRPLPVLTPAQIDDGGPAFPQTAVVVKRTGEIEISNLPNGMSLRDWFAGQALAGYISNHKACEELSSVGKNTPHFYAVLAYAMAGAMLAARKENK